MHFTQKLNGNMHVLAQKLHILENDINSTHANWNHGNDANQTVNVGQYDANPWGFFDMHGNVWEMDCQLVQEHIQTVQKLSPIGPNSGTNRFYAVVHGVIMDLHYDRLNPIESLTKLIVQLVWALKSPTS